MIPVLDDASFLAPSDPMAATSSGDTAKDRFQIPTGSYIAATVGPEAWREGTRTLSQMAGVLDRAAELTGLPVYLLPHMGTLGAEGEGGDHESHRMVLEFSRSGRLQALPVLPVRAAAAVTQSASLVITNRYHPAVFGLAAGVPTTTLSNDAYSDVRLCGAMGNWGLAEWALPLPSLASGGLDDAVAEAWARRHEISKHLESVRPDRQGTQAIWWDAVAGMFTKSTVATAVAVPPTPLRSGTEWATQAHQQRELFRTLSGGIGRLWTEWDDVRSERDNLLHERDELLRERDMIRRSRSFRIATALRRSVKFKRMERRSN